MAQAQPKMHERKMTAKEQAVLDKKRRQLTPDRKLADLGGGPDSRTVPVILRSAGTLASPADTGRPTPRQTTRHSDPPAPKATPVKRDATAAPSDPRTRMHDEAAATAGAPVDIAEVPDLADVLPDLCARYREINREQARLETERKELSEQIMPLMEAVGRRSIRGDGWHAVIAKQRRGSLSKERLLENGVGMDVIEASTNYVDIEYLQVRDPESKRKE